LLDSSTKAVGVHLTPFPILLKATPKHRKFPMQNLLKREPGGGLRLGHFSQPTHFEEQDWVLLMRSARGEQFVNELHAFNIGGLLEAHKADKE
jgi:hypothetical protein